MHLSFTTVISLIPGFSPVLDGRWQANDAQNRMVPDAGNEITFAISGPGKIIGVGNGDPSSHEPDQFVESVSSLPLTGWRSKTVDSLTNRPEVAADFDDSAWQTAFGGRGGGGARRGGNTNQPTQITGYMSFTNPQSSPRFSSIKSISRTAQSRAGGNRFECGRPAPDPHFSPALFHRSADQNQVNCVASRLTRRWAAKINFVPWLSSRDTFPKPLA
jgi:hypothetical protein